MDPPPLPPNPTITTTSAAANATTITAATTTTQLSYPDSANSSPRSRQNDTWDETLPPVPGGAKLRLMCSYGGHIIPRPHDKSLCYIGGDTRIVVVDRHSSLSSVSSRLSQTLLNGRHFTLKYQLPNEDLDSLISVTTDEDLENMIEEYDRTTSASPLKPSRLRLFLFLARPETSTSMGCLLDVAKSETWFVDALNNAGLLPRGLSDSAAVDCLRQLDHGIVNSDSCTDLEAQNEALGGNKPAKSTVHDVHSAMLDSPMVESTSSFGSSSSSPSMSNLPPIKVRVEDGGARLQDQMVGLHEQFSQVNVASNVQKQDDGCVMLSAPPPLPTVIGAATASPAVAVNSMAVSGEQVNRVSSDDERSDQGMPTGFRKPPLPLQPVQRKLADAYNLPSPNSKLAGGFNLPSPDSVASDSSIASANSLSRHTIYQDPTYVATREQRHPASQTDPKSNISDPSSQIQMQQVQDYVYLQPPQQNQQQQFIRAGTHYIHHPATGPVPISSYYPMYAPPPQQQLHHQFDQQYPMYLLPVTQTQPYNLSVQSNVADATAAASSRSLTPPYPNIVAPSAAYEETGPPIYPTKTTTQTKPEMASSVYRTAATATPQLVQIPTNQFQQQYVGLSQMHHPSQSTANANYGFEYTQPTHDQVYYTQNTAAPLPPQYQTMTSAAAALLSQSSTQLPADNTKQQIITSQPL